MVVKRIQATEKQSLLGLNDKYLLAAVFLLAVIGLIMVASASMAISERLYSQPFYYLLRQATYLGLGLLGALLVVRIPMSFWYKISVVLLFFSIVLLLLVLVPGIGREVNGSTRWIGFGPLGLQVSEFAKLAVIVYLAGYAARRNKEVCSKVTGFLKPMAVLGIICFLLLLEPDFGAAVVIMTTVLAIMFLSGVRVSQFFVLFLLVAIATGILAVSSPYRMARLTGFLNPWANPFDSGYQLTQSLIAFGRGGLFGTGLGGSVQKLFYLPEAHTDFLFAVLGEELGLLGIFTVIGLYILLVSRALLIGYRAQIAGQHSSGYIAYGIAIWVSIQAAVNIGVNSGLLPTKGLTLPLISYGGSSILILFVAMAMLIRIDFEAKIAGKSRPSNQYFARKWVVG